MIAGSTKSTPSSISTIPGMIEHWQTVFGLYEWKIQYSKTTPVNPKNVLQVTIVRARKAATVTVNEAQLRLITQQELFRLLGHEMLHLVFEPVMEEYDFQNKYAMEHRSPELKERMILQMEKVVEHISHVVVDREGIVLF